MDSAFCFLSSIKSPGFLKTGGTKEMSPEVGWPSEIPVLTLPVT